MHSNLTNENGQRQSLPTMKPSQPSIECSPARIKATVGKLSLLYQMVGNPPDPIALARMAEHLCRKATDPQIDAAIGRCAEECTYPVRLPHLMERLPGGRVDPGRSEALAAWDTVVQFADKWVQSDPYGHYRIDQGCRRTPPPHLSPRILDSVRLAGGWRAIRCMKDDEPFVKKAFVEAYECWTAIREVPCDRLLAEIAQKALLAKPAPKSTAHLVDVTPPAMRAFKRIPEPLTVAQLQDRRAILKQQADQLAAEEGNHGNN
jgi:hypothetical protein